MSGYDLPLTPGASKNPRRKKLLWTILLWRAAEILDAHSENIWHPVSWKWLNEVLLKERLFLLKTGYSTSKHCVPQEQPSSHQVRWTSPSWSLTKPPLTWHLVKACVRFSWKAVLVNYWPGRPDHKHFPMWNMNLAELEYCSQKAWSFPAPHQPQCPSKSSNEGLMLQLHLYKYRYQNTVKHGLKNSLQNPQPKLLQLWFWQTRKFNILWNSMLLTSGYIIITKVTFLQRILKSGILPKKKIRRLGVENRKVFLQRTLSCITS